MEFENVAAEEQFVIIYTLSERKMFPVAVAVHPVPDPLEYYFCKEIGLALSPHSESLKKKKSTY